MRPLLILGAVLCWGLLDTAIAGAGCCGGCKKPAAKKVATAACCKDGTCDKCKAKKAAALHVSTDGLKALVTGGKGILVIDARGAKGYATSHIPGAKSLPVGSDADTIAKVLGEDKAAKIVTYCGSTKCPASAKLAQSLRKKGYTNVVEYSAGIKGWKEAGNKVEAEK